MMIERMGMQSKGLNILAINQSVAKKNEAIFAREKKEDTIQANISPIGKKQSMIQQLMKRKQELTERMQSLSADAKEGGGNIKEQMQAYQKQMETLDEQIMELQTRQEEDKEKEKSEATGIYEKPNATKEEAEAAQIRNLMSLATTSDQATTISAVKDKLDGRTNVLKAEIKSGYGNIEAKMDEVSELESRSSDLTSQISDKILETNEQINDIRETEQIKQTATDENDQNEEQEKESFSESNGVFK